MVAVVILAWTSGVQKSTYGRLIAYYQTRQPIIRRELNRNRVVYRTVESSKEVFDLTCSSESSDDHTPKIRENLRGFVG